LGWFVPEAHTHTHTHTHTHSKVGIVKYTSAKTSKLANVFI